MKKKISPKKKTVKKTKKKITPKKTGNPSQYKAVYAQMALGFCEDGNFSCRSLAKKFKVSPQTILNWKRENPDFAKAIEEGKEIAVDEIEQTYFQLALRHDEVTHNKGQMATGDVDYKSTKKDAVEVGACKSILAAHRKDKYGDKLDVTIPQAITFNIKKNYDNDGKKHS